MTDYYPESGLTPNMGMTLEGMSSGIAENFLLMDESAPTIHGALNFLSINNQIMLNGDMEDESNLHVISIYADSKLDGGGNSGDNTLSVYLSWTDPQGNLINTLVGVIDGVDPEDQYLTITIPVYPKQGSIIRVFTVYDGLLANNNFTYDISVVKVAYPDQSPIDQWEYSDYHGGAPTPLIVGKTTPIIQFSHTMIAGTGAAMTTPMVFVLPANTTYQLTMYYFPSDTSGSASQWWHPIVTWVSPSGVTLTTDTALNGLGPCGNGDPTYGQAFSLPLLVKGGTPVTITGFYTVDGYPSYGGGPCTPFPIDLSIRLVAMP